MFDVACLMMFDVFDVFDVFFEFFDERIGNNYEDYFECVFLFVSMLF